MAFSWLLEVVVHRLLHLIGRQVGQLAREPLLLAAVVVDGHRPELEVGLVLLLHHLELRVVPLVDLEELLAVREALHLGNPTNLAQQ